MIRSCLILSLLVIAGCRSSQQAAGDGRKLNIVVIVADDLGYAELGAHGGKEIPTPNIDSIARIGVRFTSAYVSCPVCSPTRAGLMTGRYQQRFGHEFNPRQRRPNEAPFGMPEGQVTLADRLKEAGYVTGMVGKWHLGDRPGTLPTERGFNEFFGFLGGAHPYLPGPGGKVTGIFRGTAPVPEPDYLTDAFAREAVAFIDRNKSKPFFLYLPFNAVHGPLQAPDKYLERFAHIGDPRRRTFAAMLAAMDDGVGAVLDKLRAEGLERDTLIFFISDNGGPTPNTTARNDPLRATKGTVYEGGIRVPFFMQWKGKLPAGKTYDQPVIALDIHATALEAGGLKCPSDLDGVNLLPFITRKSKDAPHDSLYWRFGAQRAVRHGNWKLLWDGLGGPPQLYNLGADIGELHDLASAHPDQVRELAALYDGWNGQLIAPLWGAEPGGRKMRRARQPVGGLIQ